MFRDDLTGKTANRSGLKDLLAFLKARKGRTVVIIDDLNRLARSVRTHYAIRDAVAKAGGKLESPSVPLPTIPTTTYWKSSKRLSRASIAARTPNRR
ncbi:recombinase family protein [Hankyongella ginsenosidimutans]|uniref:Recombinase family protein n=1 Tax=Hankyongella ginsenosidimutans TaxID=1763828 RepID=A0A4D7CAB2_9SPHN|nr:recombinase family protein [Hankyongella ginsenosidimutans]